MIRNLDQLIENKQKFHSFVEYYFSHPKFSGPSVYFHEKTINMIRKSNNFNDLISSQDFIECCYATLTSWGMHKMGKKGAKLKDFSSFSKAIHNNISKFVSLKTYQLKDLNTNDRSRIFSQIESLFENLDIMETDSCLVGNSKLMHHILPDLVPPIDREHTLMFFFNSKSLLSYDKEKQKFSEILENYWTICKKIDLQYEDYQKYPQFTSSIPKLIDNAIIGYIMKNNADA